MTKNLNLQFGDAAIFVSDVPPPSSVAELARQIHRLDASLLEASLELRQQLTRRWSVVGFVDAGAVGTDQFPTGKDLSAGAGLGVRYDLGFGPIRADIAFPLDKRDGDPGFQLYLSIGQSF